MTKKLRGFCVGVLCGVFAVSHENSEASAELHISFILCSNLVACQSHAWVCGGWNMKARASEDVLNLISKIRPLYLSHKVCCAATRVFCSGFV